MFSAEIGTSPEHVSYGRAVDWITHQTWIDKAAADADAILQRLDADVARIERVQRVHAGLVFACHLAELADVFPRS